MATRRLRSAAAPFLVWTTSSTPPVVRWVSKEGGSGDDFGDNSVIGGELEEALASSFKEATEGSSEEASERRRVRRFLLDVREAWDEDATVVDWIRLTRERSRELGSSDEGEMLDTSNVSTEETSTQSPTSDWLSSSIKFGVLIFTGEALEGSFEELELIEDKDFEGSKFDC